MTNIQTKIALIGAGNMSLAILEGILGKQLVAPPSVIVTNRSNGKLEKIKQRWPVKTSYDNAQAAEFADLILIAVKPNDIKQACEQLKAT